jgi:hypothetical protein
MRVTSGIPLELAVTVAAVALLLNVNRILSALLLHGNVALSVAIVAVCVVECVVECGVEWSGEW